MDGGHHDDNPFPNEHLVRFHWYRTQLELLHPFSGGWDVEFTAPYDVKDVKAQYEMPNGARFDSASGRLHHRTETLQGASDFKVMAGRHRSGVLLEQDHLHVAAGVTLPVGEIEDDPYDVPITKHQHIQFGNGTFDPLLRLDYSVQSGRWGAGLSTDLQAPLYHNRKEYQGSTVFTLSTGPRFLATDWLGVSFNYVALYQTRAYWDGGPDRNSGYFLQGLSLAAPIRLSSSLTIAPRVMRTLSIDTRSGVETFEMDWLVGVSLNYLLGSSTPPVEADPR